MGCCVGGEMSKIQLSQNEFLKDSKTAEMSSVGSGSCDDLPFIRLIHLRSAIGNRFLLMQPYSNAKLGNRLELLKCLMENVGAPF